MKVLYALFFCAFFSACFPHRELQAEMVEAVLVKVELINRYPDGKQKVTTWQTDGAGLFITFEPVSFDLPIGTHTKLLVQK